MCGISGFMRYHESIRHSDRGVLKKMNEVLYHRGPDAQDIYVHENLALGFTRLSIIGLNNGMQPLFNEDESLVLVCNGEIFNYIELRQDLQSRGHIFSSETDVEVILHLYEEHGPDFINMLNGQFAFALFDKKRRTLLCARDHLGIIPFFYTVKNDTFIFGSEIKALLQHPDVNASVDLVGLDQVFTFAGLVSPRTMFEGIKSLENGHYLLIDHNGNITKTEYWDLIFPEGPRHINGVTEEAYLKELEGLFDQSIKYRVRADVPYALYLSGGLDSSLIAMKDHFLNPGGRQAFSIDFIDSMHSESTYQKLVAQQAGAELIQHLFSFDDISNRLIKSVYHSECPIKETYNTASLALSSLVRSNNIKVVLSGEGADEFFAGYVGYRFDKMRQMGMVKNECSDEERALREALWGDETFYYERNFLEYELEKRSIYSPRLNESFDEINCLNHPLINKARVQNRDVLHKRAYIDYKIRLVDHLVSDHGDRMAMANSVEARYPFLDKDLVEFSTRVPTDLKLSDFTEKYVLRKMGDRILPKEVMNREKFHFIAPGSPYLLQQNIDFVQDLLSPATIERQGYFDVNEIGRLKKIYSQPGYKINAPYENDLLITVITFGILLDQFFE